jgi:hypothetical protein
VADHPGLRRNASWALWRRTYPAIKETYMKTMHITAMWTVGLAMGLASIVPTTSFGILGMRTEPNRIQTANEVSKLPVGTILIFTCARCKGSQSMAVDEHRTILTWFNSLTTKRCPGPCGGWVNYVSRATPAGRDYPDTFNTCSRCRRPTISWSVAKPGRTIATKAGGYSS